MEEPAMKRRRDSTDTSSMRESDPLVGRVVRKQFARSWFLGSITSFNAPFYRIEFEDGDCEDWDKDDIRRGLISDDKAQFRMGITDDADAQLFLFVIARDDDTVSGICDGIGVKHGATLEINKERFSTLRAHSTLKKGTILVMPEDVAEILRHPRKSSGTNKAKFEFCQVCSGAIASDGVPCASLGCGISVHELCLELPTPGCFYFCPRCMGIPLRAELLDLKFLHCETSSAKYVFGTSSNLKRLTYGIVNSRRPSAASPMYTISASSHGKEAERIQKKLCAFARETAPQVRFTSIVVNKNSKMGMHTDETNVGPSAIAGFGNYERGELWIHRLPGADGEFIDGGFIDLHDKTLVFDGKSPHMTMRFKGERVTCVFYTRSGWTTTNEASVSKLRALGYNLPDQAYMSHWQIRPYESEDFRLKSAIKKLVQDKRKIGTSTGFALDLRSQTLRQSTIAAAQIETNELKELEEGRPEEDDDEFIAEIAPLQRLRAGDQSCLELTELRQAGADAADTLVAQGEAAVATFHAEAMHLLADHHARMGIVVERALLLAEGYTDRIAALEAEVVQLKAQIAAGFM